MRYPGGKARLAPWMAWSFRQNGIRRPVFVEAYAGGAGASIYLLANNYVSRIEINDIDPAVAAFWRSAIYRSADFANRIERIPVTLEERDRQREVLKDANRYSDFDLGFAAWYLNRVNYSGIIRGGGGCDRRSAANRCLQAGCTVQKIIIDPNHTCSRTTIQSNTRASTGCLGLSGTGYTRRRSEFLCIFGSALLPQIRGSLSKLF